MQTPKLAAVFLVFVSPETPVPGNNLVYLHPLAHYNTVVYCFIEKWSPGQFPVDRWRCPSQINDSHLKLYQIFTLSKDLGQGCSGNWHWTRFPGTTDSIFSPYPTHSGLSWNDLFWKILNRPKGNACSQYKSTAAIFSSSLPMCPIHIFSSDTQACFALVTSYNMACLALVISHDMPSNMLHSPLYP